MQSESYANIAKCESAVEVIHTHLTGQDKAKTDRQANINRQILNMRAHE